MLVNFRYSDLDFVAYLITLGYKPMKFETKKDNNFIKTFVYFEGEKEELIKLNNRFREEKVLVNLKELVDVRKKLLKEIKYNIN